MSSRELKKIYYDTGLRRFELENLRGNQLEYRDNGYCLRIKWKGGKIRYVPIKDKAVIDRMKNTPKDRLVFEKVNTRAPIHKYRSMFATSLYNSLKRDEKDIPKEGRYVCRGGSKKTTRFKSRLIETKLLIFKTHPSRPVLLLRCRFPICGKTIKIPIFQKFRKIGRNVRSYLISLLKISNKKSLTSFAALIVAAISSSLSIFAKSKLYPLYEKKKFNFNVMILITNYF